MFFTRATSFVCVIIFHRSGSTYVYYVQPCPRCFQCSLVYLYLQQDSFKRWDDQCSRGWLFSWSGLPGDNSTHPSHTMSGCCMVLMDPMRVGTAWILLPRSDLRDGATVDISHGLWKMYRKYTNEVGRCIRCIYSHPFLGRVPYRIVSW